MSQNRVILSVASLLVATGSFAQPVDSVTTSRLLRPDPPVQVEVVADRRGLTGQTIISKPLASSSRFGFLNVTTFVGSYRNDKEANEYISQSLLTTYLGEGLSVTTGVSVNYFSGFRPTAGLQYVVAIKSWVVLLLPRFDLTETYNVETFGFIEYKPRLTRQWGLYSRLQGLFNYSTRLNVHERSHVYCRVGASHRNYQFGLGTNVDIYGPQTSNETSLVGFLRVEIF